MPENARHDDRFIKFGALAYVLQQVRDKLEADSETPPLHIKENAMEDRLQWLRGQRDAGNIEGSTQELRVVAALSSEEGEEPEQALTEGQKRAAERLEEREKRKEEKVLDSLRQLGGRRPPQDRSSGR